MSENPISISQLNDFIFCPASIYFHNLENEDVLLFQTNYQLNGTAVHKNSDFATYSTRKSVLQGISVYCEKYNLCGKIDIYDIDKGILTERKRTIKEIYDGYVFQLYGQYFSLCEMGYLINEIRFYSMSDNKVYKIDKPEINEVMFKKFEQLIYEINNFDLFSFKQINKLKCNKCIYEPLCSFSLLKGD